MPSNDHIRHKTILAIRWTAIGRLASQLFTWISTLLVIRLLLPADYGLMALAMVSYSILTIFSSGGMATGIIQAPSVSTEQIKRVLGVLVIVNGVIFLLHLLTAPIAATFYQESQVVPLIIAISLAFLIAPWETVANSTLSREMEFKKKAVIDFSIATIAAGTALAMAYHGFGVWALVASLLVNTFGTGILYTIASGCEIRPTFEVSGIGNLLRFGYYVTASSIVWAAYLQAGVFIGGRFLSSDEIGYFAVAVTLSELPATKLLPLVHQVMLPALSHIHNSGQSIKQYALFAVRIISAISFPVFFCMAAFSQEIVSLVLGDKWEETWVLLAVLSLSMPFRIVMNIFPSIVRAVGRPDIALRNAVFMLITLSSLLFAFVHIGSLGLALAWLVAAPIGAAYALSRSSALIKSSLREVISNASPYFTAGLLSFGGTYAALLLLRETYYVDDILALFSGSTVGALLYVAIGYVFHRPMFFEVIGFVKTLIRGS